LKESKGHILYVHPKYEPIEKKITDGLYGKVSFEVSKNLTKLKSKNNLVLTIKINRLNEYNAAEKKT